MPMNLPTATATATAKPNGAAPARDDEEIVVAPIAAAQIAQAEKPARRARAPRTATSKPAAVKKTAVTKRSTKSKVTHSTTTSAPKLSRDQLKALHDAVSGNCFVTGEYQDPWYHGRDWHVVEVGADWGLLSEGRHGLPSMSPGMVWGAVAQMGERYYVIVSDHAYRLKGQRPWQEFRVHLAAKLDEARDLERRYGFLFPQTAHETHEGVTALRFAGEPEPLPLDHQSTSTLTHTGRSSFSLLPDEETPE